MENSLEKSLIVEDSSASCDQPENFIEAHYKKATANTVARKSKSFPKIKIFKSNRVSPCGVKMEKRNKSKLSSFFTNVGKNIRKGFTRLLNNSGNEKRINRRVFFGVPMFFYYKY